MIGQFPSDFNTHDDDAKKPEGPSQAQIEKQEKADLVAYAEQVSTEAAEYQNKIKEQEKDENDAHAYDNMDEEAMVQLSSK